MATLAETLRARDQDIHTQATKFLRQIHTELRDIAPEPQAIDLVTVGQEIRRKAELAYAHMNQVAKNFFRSIAEEEGFVQQGLLGGKGLSAAQIDQLAGNLGVETHSCKILPHGSERPERLDLPAQ